MIVRSIRPRIPGRIDRTSGVPVLSTGVCRVTLRYGWREMAGDPCGVAGEVAAVLGRLGWPGRPNSCGPGCRTADPDRAVDPSPESGTDRPHDQGGRLAGREGECRVNVRVAM